MNEIHKSFLKLEAAIFAMALIPAVIYAFNTGVAAGLNTLLVCFGVPQPFLLYAFKDVLFRRNIKPD